MSGINFHAAAVHFPITFVALTGILDSLNAAATFSLTAPYVASAFESLKVEPSLLGHLHLLSYYTTVLALITTVPAVLTGFSHLLPLLVRDGINTPKARTALSHAALNDVATFSLAYNWWTRRTVEGFEAAPLNVALSGLLAVPIMFYAASLGGHLVFGYGMGVGKSSKGKKTE